MIRVHHIKGQPLGDQSRFVAPLDLDRHLVAHLHFERRPLRDREQFETASNAPAGRNRRDEPNFLETIVDANGDATRPRTEVFTFATRLTRLTPFLAAASPETMLAKAGEAAPDWAGGTRIGAALREFNDRYAVRGMGRGAVILIISDGWETGDPAALGAQLARPHRIA